MVFLGLIFFAVNDTSLIYYEYVRIFQGRFVLFSFVPVEVWGLSFVVLNFEEFYGIFADCFV